MHPSTRKRKKTNLAAFVVKNYALVKNKWDFFIIFSQKCSQVDLWFIKDSNFRFFK